MTIIGIDPGKSGGIAILDSDVAVYTYPMPESLTDLYGIINDVELAEATVFVEKVNAGPKMGSSAAYKFGYGVGSIAMAVIAAYLRLEWVTPQKWQREFGLIVKGRGLGQGDTEKKNRNKARAQELFPKLKITHAIADALLIAEYGRRVVASRTTLERKAEA